MEFRRLISFGKSSFVISLPKAWISQNKLKKGDLIYLEESGPKLVISKKENEGGEAEKEKTIYIDGKDTVAISREICAAYIQNNHKIIFRGKEVKTRIKELQGVVQSLIALEIMEQTEDSVIARDFLNMDTVSVAELIRKMDIVTRTMMKEACNIFIEDNYESLNQRDRDVNRLYFLFYRTILYSLENPLKALKNFKLSGLDILKTQYIGFYIEAIADEARRTARYARLLKLNPQKQKQIQKIMAILNEHYVETMKAAYNKDLERAFVLSGKKNALDKDIDALEEDIPKIPDLNKVIIRLQRMNSLIHNLGRIVYTIN